MIKQNILKELGECINSVLEPQFQFSHTTLIKYFLGEKLENTFKPSFLEKLYMGDRHSLSPESLVKLASSKDWTICRLKTFNQNIKNDNSAIKKAVAKLYKKYFPDFSGKQKFGVVVRSLVNLHFFGTEAIEDLFYPYSPQYFTTCEYYVPWNEKENELHQLLKDHFLVFITGLPASGKKQMVKHYISSNCRWNDIFWLKNDLGLPLSEQIANIKFLCETRDLPLEPEDILDLLKYKTDTSLLIINIPFIKQDDYNFIEQHLHDLELNIIIITKTIDILPSYKSVNIDNRPVENLKNIFEMVASKYNKQDYAFERFFSLEGFDNLCSIISNNPFFVEIFAKVLISNKISMEDMNTIINTQTWYIGSKPVPKVHSSYYHNGKKTGISITALVEEMFYYYNKEDKKFLEKTGSELSILAKNEVPESYLLKRGNISVSDIEKALDLGILQYIDSEKNILQMPSIIADVIWQMYSIDFKKYKKQINELLLEISCGQIRLFQYQTLYDHVLTIIYRFHFQITKTNTKKPPAKVLFLEWNYMLSDLILHFIRLGNTYAAKNILSRLYIYENKSGKQSDLVQLPQLWERDIFQLYIEFAQNISLYETLDKASQLIKSKKSELNHSIKSHLYLLMLKKSYNFIMYIIDDAILRFLLMSVEGSENLKKFTGNLIKTISSLIDNSIITNCNIVWGNSRSSANSDITVDYLIDPLFVFYYRMILFYLAGDISNAEKSFEKLEIKSEIQFRARIWKLYYEINYLVKIQNPQKTINLKQIFCYIAEYLKLSKEFHNKIISLHTTVLFCYCSIAFYYFIPSVHFFVRTVIRSTLEEAFESLISQACLSGDDTEHLSGTLQEIFNDIEFNFYITEKSERNEA